MVTRSLPPPVALLSLLLALLVGAACGDEKPSGAGAGDAGGCPPCGVDEACDPVSSRCVLGLLEAEECGLLADGGVVEGHCRAGLVCGSVGASTKRCSVDCNSTNALSVCGTGRECFARPDGSKQGFCGTRAAAGENCDGSALVFCGAEQSCITPAPGVTTGRCFTNCVPGSGSCGLGQSCADPFVDQSRGFCVVPAGGYPNRCNHSTLEFCGEGELCARPTEEEWGYCHRRCEQASDCDGQSCVHPLPNIGFCVEPVQSCEAGGHASLCQACDAEQDLYCGSDDICVQLGESTVCKRDCTDDESVCESGTQCTVLQDSFNRACL